MATGRAKFAQHRLKPVLPAGLKPRDGERSSPLEILNFVRRSGAGSQPARASQARSSASVARPTQAEAYATKLSKKPGGTSRQAAYEAAAGCEPAPPKGQSPDTG